MERKILRITMALAIFAVINLGTCPANALEDENDSWIVSTIKKRIWPNYDKATDDPKASSYTSFPSFIEGLKTTGGQISGIFINFTKTPDGRPETQKAYILGNHFVTEAFDTCKTITKYTAGVVGIATLGVAYASPYILQGYCIANNYTIPAH